MGFRQSNIRMRSHIAVVISTRDIYVRTVRFSKVKETGFPFEVCHFLLSDHIPHARSKKKEKKRDTRNVIDRIPFCARDSFFKLNIFLV